MDINKTEFEEIGKTYTLLTLKKLMRDFPPLVNGLNAIDVVICLKLFQSYYLDKIESQTTPEVFKEILKAIQIKDQAQEHFDKTIDKVFTNNLIIISNNGGG